MEILDPDVKIGFPTLRAARVEALRAYLEEVGDIPVDGVNILDFREQAGGLTVAQAEEVMDELVGMGQARYELRHLMPWLCEVVPGADADDTTAATDADGDVREAA